MKQLVCILALSSTACGMTQTVKQLPTFTSQYGIQVYVDSNTVLDSNTFDLDVSGYLDIATDSVPALTRSAMEQVLSNNISVYVSNRSFSGSECGNINGCYGYRNGNVIHVGIVDSACFSNNALGHELTHLLLDKLTHDADANHTQIAFWGYTGLVNAVKLDVGSTCITGANITET